MHRQQRLASGGRDGGSNGGGGAVFEDQPRRNPETMSQGHSVW
jgi:hypothetical protein